MTLTDANIFRLSPEYACFPLWSVGTDGGLKNAVAHSFGLPKNLADEIEAWGDIFESTYNSEYPPHSGFDSEGEVLNFKARGEELKQKLEQFFGGERTIEFRVKNVTIRQMS
ncbi:hypothetical protein [uncultured Litoreibacter sp.]|uniref:hypothetical protein n=1 Tax=uncultured Litoreibacter sp. TaxID=1392394 RepID=UPI00261AE6D5|nr:hypothetical protein [uncultured Litoreibacter sp.]